MGLASAVVTMKIFYLLALKCHPGLHIRHIINLNSMLMQRYIFYSFVAELQRRVSEKA